MRMKQSIVLCVSGFDPTGGAGLQADIETIAAIGLRAVCAQTCNTLQNAGGVTALMPTPAATLSRQIESLCGDFDVAAVKVGAVASAENAQAIARSLSEIACPLIVDPVLRDGTAGKSLGNEDTAWSIREYLLPMTTCTTPNRAELMTLSPETTTTVDAATALLKEGCEAVFATSEKQTGETLCHVLYTPEIGKRDFFTTQLPGEFHGSGCTLSSALAAYIALGNTVPQAIASALAFTARALEKATTPEREGKRKFPDRSCQTSS